MEILHRLLRRQKLEQQLDKELTFHLEQLQAAFERDGHSPERARQLARREFGGRTQVEEQCREERGTRPWEDLLRDCRISLRAILQKPLFSATIIGTLALGIGANTGVFSVLDLMLLRKLNLPAVEELQLISNVGGVTNPGAQRSWPHFTALRAALPPGDQAAAMTGNYAAQAVWGSGEPERIQLQLVSGEWFDTLGVKAAIGRLFTPEDNRTINGHPVIVLSHSYWRDKRLADPNILGKTVTINRVVFTVIGVAEPSFRDFGKGLRQGWIPIMMQSAVGYAQNASSENLQRGTPWPSTENVWWLTIVARTKNRDLLQARWRPIHEAEQKRVAVSASPDQRKAVSEKPLLFEAGAYGMNNTSAATKNQMWLVLATTFAVLVLCCVNLAGLLLAQGLGRQHEFSIRLSLGATRAHLMRLLVVEAALYALAGGILGYGVARLSAAWLLKFNGANAALIDSMQTIDHRMVLFTLATTTLVAMLVGLLPALRITRPSTGSSKRVTTALPLGRLFVGSQIMLSLLLLVIAGMFTRTLQNLLGNPVGFEKEHAVVLSFDTRAAGYDENTLAAYRARVLSAASTLPQVRAASIASAVPFDNHLRISGYSIPTFDPVNRPSLNENFVDHNFRKTLGVPLLEGRDFGPEDTAKSPKVVLINRALAQKYFANQKPVGQSIAYGESDTSKFRIIGITENFLYDQLRDQQPQPMVLHLADQHNESSNNLLVRVDGDPALLKPALRSLLVSVDKAIRVADVKTLAELADVNLDATRATSKMIQIFSGVALLLASMGLFGVLWHMQQNSRKEMSIRMALGADRVSIGRGMLRPIVPALLLGIAAGCFLSSFAAQQLQAVLFGLSPFDWPSVLTGVGILLLCASVAAMVPMWRTITTDPMAVLRQE